MSVAFDLEVTRSTTVGRVRALAALVPAAGLALAALRIASGPTFLIDAPAAVRLPAAAACLLAAVALAVAALHALRGGGASPGAAVGVRLQVDDDGEPALLDRAGEPARPMALRASCALPGLTLVVLAPYLPQPSSRRRARPTALLLGRDAVPADAWRRLHVWLRWTERGLHGPGPHRP